MDAEGFAAVTPTDAKERIRVVDPRARACYAIARVLLSWIPPPAGSRSSAAPGFASERSRWETCSDCLANGRVLPTCETCHGRGETFVGGRDPYADPPRSVPADPRRIAAGFGGADRELARDRARAVELELERLEEDARIRAGKHAPGDRATRAIDARDRLYRRGSVDKVARALEQLRDLSPADYRHAWRIVMSPPPLSEPVTPVTARAFSRLAALVPDPIVVPRGVPVADADETLRLATVGKEALWRGRTGWARATRAQRDQRIRDLHEAGATVSAIAMRVHVSRRRVQQILRAAGEEASGARGVAASVSGVSGSRCAT